MVQIPLSCRHMGNVGLVVSVTMAAIVAVAVAAIVGSRGYVVWRVAMALAEPFTAMIAAGMSMIVCVDAHGDISDARRDGAPRRINGAWGRRMALAAAGDV